MRTGKGTGPGEGHAGGVSRRISRRKGHSGSRGVPPSQGRLRGGRWRGHRARGEPGGRGGRGTSRVRRGRGRRRGDRRHRRRDCRFRFGHARGGVRPLIDLLRTRLLGSGWTRSFWRDAVVLLFQFVGPRGFFLGSGRGLGGRGVRIFPWNTQRPDRSR